MTEARVSVLIVNFNSTDLLRDCLNAVFASNYADELEVIVVDNASEDFSLAALEIEFPTVEWLPQRVNTTCTGGNNLALRQASGDMILMLNPDTKVESRAIANAVRHLTESPDLVAVGAYLVDSTGRLQRGYYRRLPTFLDIPILLFEPLFRTTRRGRRFLMTDEALEGETTVDHAAGAFLLMRRAALKEWLMEPGYFNLLSDLDLSRRLATVGRVAVFNDVRCYHLGGGGGMGTDDSIRRLRFHHDFTWGLRRYFRPELNAVQRAGLEMGLALYWTVRATRVLLTRPKHFPRAIAVAFDALSGRAPHY